jgi:flagellar biosynthesis/type III secretory pathway protein FliH
VNNRYEAYQGGVYRLNKNGRSSVWPIARAEADTEAERIAEAERIVAALNAQLPVRAVEYGSREHADKLSAEIAELRETLEKANDAYAQGVTAGRSEALNAQAGVVEALEWIARVNATEAEYQKVARAALAAIKEKDRG